MNAPKQKIVAMKIAGRNLSSSFVPRIASTALIPMHSNAKKIINPQISIIISSPICTIIISYHILPQNIAIVNQIFEMSCFFGQNEYTELYKGVILLRKFITILLIFLSIFSIFPHPALAKEKYSPERYNTEEIKTVDNHKELLREIGIAVSFFKPSITIHTSFEPKRTELSFPNIAEQSRKIDAFTGSLLNAFKYQLKRSGSGYDVTFTFSYYISEKQYYELKDFSDKFAESMEGWSDYDKVKYTHDYLIENCVYDRDRDGPYNCIVNKRCNCNGYALAFCLIMQSCNIECHYITGTDHAWNAVKIGAFWYNIDVTWDDTGDGISYDYFLCGRSDWKGHRTTEATAGYKYSTNEFENWLGTMFYWGWLPMLIALASATYIIIRRKRGSIYT